MLNRKLATTVAILAAAAGLSAFTATASADVVDNDPVTLSSDQPDFTGNVAFNFSGGLMTPEVTGTLSVEDGGNSCVRVLIEHYDGTTLLDTEEGNAMCVLDDSLHEWNVNRSGVSNALTDRVVVSVQSQPFSDWITEDSATIVMNTFVDPVIVATAGNDIGGPAFAGGVPTTAANLAWNLVDGQVTPTFAPTLHLTNFVGSCGRVKLRFLTDAGVYLDKVTSSAECPATNGHHDYPVSLPPYTSGLIGQVEVQAQTRAGGAWNVAGSTTVSMAE